MYIQHKKTTEVVLVATKCVAHIAMILYHVWEVKGKERLEGIH